MLNGYYALFWNSLGETGDVLVSEMEEFNSNIQ
jgi:hypothetical protein